METLMGWFVVAAFAIPVAFYSAAMLLMGGISDTGGQGAGTGRVVESPYQPMRMLTARAAPREAIVEGGPEPSAPGDAAVAA